MVQAAQIRNKIMDALDRVEQRLAGTMAEGTAQEAGQAAELAARVAAKSDELAGCRSRNGRLRTRLDRLGQKYADLSINHAEQMQALSGEIIALRQANGELLEQSRVLRASLDAGTLGADEVNNLMQAELNALRAERELERRELRIVEQELENILELGEADEDRAVSPAEEA